MSKPSPHTAAGAWLREPTLHFFVIAALLFAVYSYRQDSSRQVLEISQSEIDARVFMQELASGEAATPQQRDQIASLYVEEQILVQEALKMGLDNDARIHDMLAQKMRHVLSGEIMQPGDAELAEYYAANQDRYITLPTVTTEELVFNNPDELSSPLQSMLADGASPADMLALESGSVSLLRNANRMDLRNIFSEEFGDSVFNAEPGAWVGPFISNRGQHWLRVEERSESGLPPLNDIIDRVRLDWIAEKEEARLGEEIKRLWEQYSIVITDYNE